MLLVYLTLLYIVRLLQHAAAPVHPYSGQAQRSGPQGLPEPAQQTRLGSNSMQTIPQTSQPAEPRVSQPYNPVSRAFLHIHKSS